MFSLDRDQDTVCAVSTPSGVGAIAIVRLSGPRTIEIARKIAPFLPENLESHHVYYGVLVAQETNVEIDEVLASFFAKGMSFTGEDTFEFSCHGSPAITQTILQTLVLFGARTADKGEFTYRAFSNGRIDLAQAESVLLLIESQSKQAARLALRQLRGEMSAEYLEIEDKILWALSRLEANIDFAAEDIEFAASTEIEEKLRQVQTATRKLLKSYIGGRLVNEGARIAIVGAPNVGKSSLLNVLGRENRAIVSPYAGTTRDTIESQIELNGMRVCLVDTAGIRETDNEIEKLGIERANEELKSADIILYVRAANDLGDDFVNEQMNKFDKPLIEIVNKFDLAPQIELKEYQLFCSATTGFGIDTITEKISEILQRQTADLSAAVMVSRQYEQLIKIEDQITKTIGLIEARASSEFSIAELNEALFCTMGLTGRRFDDEVLDKVFRDFCLGK